MMMTDKAPMVLVSQPLGRLTESICSFDANAGLDVNEMYRAARPTKT